MKKSVLIAAVLQFAFTGIIAQQSNQLQYSNRFSILAGLIQPFALSGGNVELNYFTNRLSFDYSHGFSLDPPSAGDFKKQNLSLHLPYSTGFGIGYRFTSFLDIRIEPKLHSWEVYYDAEQQTAENRIAKFNTFTIGAGIYYRYMPFRNSESKWLQGITTSSSVRYWPNIGSTLSDDKFTYNNSKTGKTETFKAPNIGIANSPIIVNVAVGYTFGGK
ncbi:MAG: hypothetical protein ACRC3B_19450 [Bacteroidia bacterium]